MALRNQFVFLSIPELIFKKNEVKAIIVNNFCENSINFSDFELENGLMSADIGHLDAPYDPHFYTILIKNEIPFSASYSAQDDFNAGAVFGYYDGDKYVVQSVDEADIDKIEIDAVVNMIRDIKSEGDALSVIETLSNFKDYHRKPYQLDWKDQANKHILSNISYSLEIELA